MSEKVLHQNRTLWKHLLCQGITFNIIVNMNLRNEPRAMPSPVLRTGTRVRVINMAVVINMYFSFHLLIFAKQKKN